MAAFATRPAKTMGLTSGLQRVGVQATRRPDESKILRCVDRPGEVKFTPRPHQERAIHEFLNTNERGLLLYHALGSGKTCTAYQAVDNYRNDWAKRGVENLMNEQAVELAVKEGTSVQTLEEYCLNLRLELGDARYDTYLESLRNFILQDLPVYIFAPAALAATHRKEYCTKCGMHPRDFEENFHFFSYNNRTGIQGQVERLKESGVLNNAIIIVDEVQEILNGAENKSKSLLTLFNALYQCQGRLLLLSGTPIYSPIQGILLMNLLKPGSITETTEAKLFSRIKQEPDYFHRQCRGLISYVPVPNPETYPSRVSPDIFEICPMSLYQFEQYSRVRSKEQEQFMTDNDKIESNFRQGQVAQGKQQQAMNFLKATLLLSRQQCNIAYPRNVLLIDPKGGIGKQKHDDSKSDWMLDDSQIADLRLHSPKLQRLMFNILSRQGVKHMVYSWYKTGYGLYLIAKLLKHCGMSSLLFSGDLHSEEERSSILKMFNSSDNNHGEKFPVILISGAGAMGISLTAVRFVHIFEAGINEFLVTQAEGRAFRDSSHLELPLEERNVQVIRYISTLPRDSSGDVISKVGNEPETTEEMIYKRALLKKKRTEFLLNAFKYAAFDCREPYNHAIHQMCISDGGPDGPNGGSDVKLPSREPKSVASQLQSEIVDLFPESKVALSGVPPGDDPSGSPSSGDPNPLVPFNFGLSDPVVPSERPDIPAQAQAPPGRKRPQAKSRPVNPK